MMTFKEVNEQFDKEEVVWKEKMDNLFNTVVFYCDLANAEKESGKWMSYMDKAMAVVKEMHALDSEHKKFLLKWQRKAHIAIICDIFRGKS